MIKLLKDLWVRLVLWFRPPKLTNNVQFIKSEWDDTIKKAFDNTLHDTNFGKIKTVTNEEILYNQIKLFYKDYRHTLNGERSVNYKGEWVRLWYPEEVEKFYDKNIYPGNHQTS